MGDKLDDREMGAPRDVTFQLRGAAADVTGTVEVEEQHSLIHPGKPLITSHGTTT